jgi:hypothetical protein
MAPATASVVQSPAVLSTDHLISTFGEDEAGNLYLVNRSTGTIYQIVEAP